MDVTVGRKEETTCRGAESLAIFVASSGNGMRPKEDADRPQSVA